MLDAIAITHFHLDHWGDLVPWVWGSFYRRGHDDVRPALGRLREDVRTVIREVRDTLYDLRTDVSDEQGFLATLERAGLVTLGRGKVTVHEPGRLRNYIH